jgi:hypothetical protein
MAAMSTTYTSMECCTRHCTGAHGRTDGFGRSTSPKPRRCRASWVHSRTRILPLKHKKSGRLVQQDMFPFHSWAFQEGLLHAENLGGDIDLVLGQRCLIGAFPWRYEGLEGCPCRIVCFLDTDMSVEAVGDAANAIIRS